MCILIACKPGATPDRAALERSAEANPDGFGYAILASDGIISSTSMKAEEAIDGFLVDRWVHPDTYAIFHARIGTHGTNSLGNCHPFRLGSDPKIVVAHNGILPSKVKATRKKSDTRVFANSFFDSHGFDVADRQVYGAAGLDIPEVKAQWENWLGGNKIAFLSASSRLREPLYILNEHLGDWEKGIWYSNDSWRDWMRRGWTGWSSRSLLVPQDRVPAADSRIGYGEHCENCGAYVTEDDYARMVCGLCRACLYCGDEQFYCLCDDDERWEDKEEALADKEESLFATMTEEEWWHYQDRVSAS